MVASALINNDWTGLEHDGINAVQELWDWLKTHEVENCLNCDNQNCAGNYDSLICDVMDYTFSVLEN